MNSDIQPFPGVVSHERTDRTPSTDSLATLANGFDAMIAQVQSVAQGETQWKRQYGPEATVAAKPVRRKRTPAAKKPPTPAP